MISEYPGKGGEIKSRTDRGSRKADGKAFYFRFGAPPDYAGFRRTATARLHLQEHDKFT